MIFISEKNNHNQAYQILVDYYIEKPDKEQKLMLNNLFMEWSKSGKHALLNHLIEIIEVHESKEIRELALKNLRKNLPIKKQEAIIEIWITHPTPSLRDYIKELVEDNNSRKSLIAAAYVMLSDWHALNIIDPDYKHLDNYLKDLDSLLGSLLFDRIKKLKTTALGEKKGLTTSIEQEELSVIDLIRRKDYFTLWENILEYPLPFICELFKLFYQESWYPIDKSSKEIFEILMELLGTEGWKGVEEVKWQVISKQKENKFIPLDNIELRKRRFDLHISQELIIRPDRISSQKFRSRGRYSLTETQIGLNIYQKMIRRSDLDGLLHIPIYANNGAELAEFVIPAPSTGSFQMDEDGAYFTVRNKYGFYSFDVDALAAFLLPVKRHSEAVSEIIPTMLERSKGSAKFVLESLSLISTLHRGREYVLWDLKQMGEWKLQNKDKLYQQCFCSIGVDLGNTITKVVLVVGGKCDHKTREWKIPSLIHYFSPSNYIIGNKIIIKNLENSSQTFKNWKYGYQNGNRNHIRIHNTIISAQKAYEDFICKLIDEVFSDIKPSLSAISFTYPLETPSGFEAWLREIISNFDFSRIEFIDSCSSTIVGTYRLHNQRGNVLLIDVGSSQMSAVIASLPQPKSRKRKENLRMREINISNPTIIAKMSISIGSLHITTLLRDLAFNEIESQKLTQKDLQMLEDSKIRLSFDFEDEIELTNYEILKFSLNEKVEEGFLPIHQAFEESKFYQTFKLLIRNVLIKGTQRGYDKSKIDTVLITGKGFNWPPLLEYIHNIFSDKKIIIEDDPGLSAKGAGLINNGQYVDFYLERDLTLKVASDGIISYIMLLNRGEKISNYFKTFEIRPQAKFDKIVLDCWSRKPKFIVDENTLPLHDNDRNEYRKDDEQYFNFERIYRELAPIGKNSLLKVCISSRATLSFIISQDDEQTILHTFTNII